MTLKELPIGKTATVRTVGGEGALRQHFLDMGIIPGAEVTMVKYAPMGDPVEVRIHSYELTLRLADAGRIAIDEMRDAVKEKEQPDAKAIPHPGFGEGGKYHNKAEEHPLPEGEPVVLCAGRKPELRQDHPVQPTNGIQPARRKLPRRDRRPEGR